MKIPVSQYVDQIKAGNRRFIAKAITLIESERSEKFEKGQAILEKLLPFTGNALRIGITGVPGVGKSTLIETLGLYLIEKGHRVAVLTVDPSSTITGGSIMGDKTRMNRLSSHDHSFIRPSPTGGLLGGVARKTRETMMICEAARYDICIVETVGVGQSEITVATMVDCFLTLLLPNAGDELQGIKKGLLELSDILIINKADQKNEVAAKQALAEYSNAIKLLRPPKDSWVPQTLMCSALENRGIDKIWETILHFKSELLASGEWEVIRQQQATQWMWVLIEQELKSRFQDNSTIQKLIPSIEQSVTNGDLTPTAATRQLLDAWKSSFP